MYGLIRPLLFQLDAERAHRLALAWGDVAAASGLGRMMLPKAPAPFPTKLLGLTFPNPVGLAASTSSSVRSGETLTSSGTRRPCCAASFSCASRRVPTSARSCCSSCSSRRPAVLGEEMLTVT